MFLEGSHGFSVETAALRWGKFGQLDRRLSAVFSVKSPRCTPSSKPSEEVLNSQWNSNDKEEKPHDAQVGSEDYSKPVRRAEARRNDEEYPNYELLSSYLLNWKDGGFW